MHDFRFDSVSSAGRRTSASPDHALSQSPHLGGFINQHLSPSPIRFLLHSGDEEDGEGSLDDSSEHGFDSSSVEEEYDNTRKQFYYDSDEDWDFIAPDEKPHQGDDDDTIVHPLIEREKRNSKQNLGQAVDDHGSQSDNSNAHGASVTPVKSPENLVDSPTSKLLASCLDTDQPFLHDYLTRRKTVAVQFLEHNKDVIECFLARHPEFVIQFLRRNQQQAWTLFVEDPRWYLEQHLNKYRYLSQDYLMEHPEDVEIFINANPKYFDQYLINHPEFAVNYLYYNRLPSDFGLPPDMFGVTSVVIPPQPHVQTPSPTSAGLPSPNSSPVPLPPPLPHVDGPGRRSTTRGFQVTRKLPKKPAKDPQQSSTKVGPAVASSGTKQNSSKSAMAAGSAPVSSLDDAPITPNSGAGKTTRPPHSKSTIANAVPASSNSSSQVPKYKALLNSSSGQIAGQFLDYPAPADLLAASRKQEAGTKGSWRLFEEDRAIKHMLDVRDEARLAGESRFEEVSSRLKAESIDRGFFAVKNYWNRTGRARSGFDERKNKTAPLATSKQGKAFRKKVKEKSKRKKGKDTKSDSEGEEDDDGDDSEYSVHSEEEDTPPPPPPLPPPPPPPPPVPAPAPARQKSATKRPADHDDEALAWAMSRGTRPKKQRTG